VSGSLGFGADDTFTSVESTTATAPAIISFESFTYSFMYIQKFSISVHVFADAATVEDTSSSITFKPSTRATAYLVHSTKPPTLVPISKAREAAVLKI
jgi:hypothetical protein